MTLRIAHLIESDGPGGAERVLAYLASALHETGAYSLAIVPANGEGWLGAELQRTGVPTETAPLAGSARQAIQWLTQTFRRHQINVAHSHEFSMAVYGAAAAWRTGARHVITMHGSRYYAGRLRRRLALRAAIAVSARTIAVSQNLAAHLCRDLWIPRTRVRVIANGVRHVAPAPNAVTLRDELQLGSTDMLAVSVGNLYPVKGHRHLIEALGMLHSRYPGLHVAIAGRGDEAEALKTQAGVLGVSNRLHLLGLRSDISAVLAAADVFVLPSLSEGLPMALLEAMFAARPIVATDVGEIGNALERGSAGLLVPPGNATALAATLDRVLSDPATARQLGERAAQRAAREYGLGTMIDRYMECYVGSSSASTLGARSR